MHTPSSLGSSRRVALVIWLALLLPVAQFAASWHVISHAASIAGEAVDEKGAPHQVHCDLCVAAAAIGGGAWIDEPVSIVHPVVAHQVPHGAVASTRRAATVAAYLSRAPPFASV